MARQKKSVAPFISPTEALAAGVQILEPALLPFGFRFHFQRGGPASGGNYACGDFVRGDRRLEMHFRRSLGLVRYHVGSESAWHEGYMKELGIWGQCQYPPFSEDWENGFRALAHDLRFAEDFLAGPAHILGRAAKRAAAEEAARNATLKILNTGDRWKLNQLRAQFHEGHYAQVAELAGAVRYPSRMSPVEVKMVEIARKKLRPAWNFWARR